MSVNQDIQYYSEFLKNANIIERSDPSLCANLISKCIALIENNQEDFLNHYPKFLCWDKTAGALFPKVPLAATKFLVFLRDCHPLAT